MSLASALEELENFLAGYQQARRTAPPSRIELLIICPDCGKNPPFRNRCPKCGGDSWIPAGLVSGIFEWLKARQWRSVVGPPTTPGVLPLAPSAQEPAAMDRRKVRRQKRKGRR